MKTQKLNLKRLSLNKEIISDLYLNNVRGGENYGTTVRVCPNFRTDLSTLSFRNETENTLNGPIMPKYPY